MEEIVSEPINKEKVYNNGVFPLNKLLLAFFLVVSSGLSNCGIAKSFYVSTEGSSSGNGSASKPWDLKTALKQPSSLQAGDTLWVAPGVYSGDFVSTISGEAEKPIYIFPLNGPVIIDGASGARHNTVLTIKGAHARYHGFNITNSNPDKVSQESGRRPSDLSNKTGLSLRDNLDIHVINFVINNHSGKGVGLWATSIDTKLSGALIYNNGYEAKDRNHGPGLYIQNKSPSLKTVANCIIAQNKSHGIQAFATKGSVENIRFEENIIFNNEGFNIVIGGQTRADNIELLNNTTYSATNDINIKIGLNKAVKNGQVSLVANRFLGGFKVIQFTKWEQIRFEQNVVSCTPKERLKWEGMVAELDPESVSSEALDWNNNTYYNITDNRAFSLKKPNDKTAKNYPLASWRNTFGLDGSSIKKTQAPPNNYLVQGHIYDKNRYNLVIMNLENLEQVQVDLNKHIKPGQRFTVHSIPQEPGKEYYSGTFTGDFLEITMTNESQMADSEQKVRPIIREFAAFTIHIQE